MPRFRRWRDPARLDIVHDLQRCFRKEGAYGRSNTQITSILRSNPQPLREARAAKARFANLKHQIILQRERLEAEQGRRSHLPPPAPEDVNEPLDLPWSALDGAVAGIKDNIRTVKPWPTTGASNMLRDFESPTDATVVTALRKAGVAILSKTNMDEFGMGSYSTLSAFRSVKNGVGQVVLSPGGSSGGSALAVALSQCHIALGTDTGGSVRLPAAYTGVIGFKPSYGLLSRYGVIPYANSLDTVGIFAQSCSDIRDAFGIMKEHDEKDPTSLSPTSRQKHTHFSADDVSQIFCSDSLPVKTAAARNPPRRIGVPLEYNIAELDSRIQAAWIRALSLLESKGHEIVPISLPTTRQALSAYYILAPAEASSNLAKYDAIRYGNRVGDSADDENGILYTNVRGAKLGPEVQRRILLGTYTLSAESRENYFIQAQKIRRLVQQDFDRVFCLPNPLHSNPPPEHGGVDFVVTPTAPTRPPKLDQLAHVDPVEAYINDVFTVPASLAGLPALSIPAPVRLEANHSREVFAGIQVIGQVGDDAGVLEFSKENLERSQDLDWISTKVERGNRYLIQ